MYARFGSRVTVVQRAERLVPNEEPEVSAVLLDVFRREGIEVVTGAAVVGVKQSSAGVVVNARVGTEEKTFQSARLMLAAGRTPNTESLNLEVVGVETDRAGFIKIDDRFQTSAEGVWAIGDGPLASAAWASLVNRSALVPADVAVRLGIHAPVFLERANQVRDELDRHHDLRADGRSHHVL